MVPWFFPAVTVTSIILEKPCEVRTPGTPIPLGEEDARSREFKRLGRRPASPGSGTVFLTPRPRVGNVYCVPCLSCWASQTWPPSESTPRLQAPPPGNSDSADQQWGSRICIFNKFPSDRKAAGSGDPTLGTTGLTQYSPVRESPLPSFPQ